VWQPESRGRNIGLRLLVVLSGTTAFGFVHVISEYFTMLSFGGGNGDTPIGYGYLIFAAITISAILTVIMTLRAPQKVADAEPHRATVRGPIVRQTFQDLRQQVEYEYRARPQSSWRCSRLYRSASASASGISPS
jgi:hypothetical protein